MKHFLRATQSVMYTLRVYLCEPAEDAEKQKNNLQWVRNLRKLGMSLYVLKSNSLQLSSSTLCKLQLSVKLNSVLNVDKIKLVYKAVTQ